MNCLIYSRVSTSEQALKGRSIDDQIRICDKFAKDNGYDIVGIYKDPGKSASTMNRPALQDLIIRCKDDKTIDAVLVQDTDRLARNTYDHLQIKLIFKKYDVKLISVSQPMLSDESPESEFIDVVIAGANTLQSRITGRKTAKVLEERIKDGWWCGWCPIGYKNAQVDNKNIIILDKERISYMKRAFELFATRNYSVEALCDFLYEKGFRTRSGGKVGRAVLTKALQNPFYIGKMLYKGKIYQGKHPAIISEVLFNLCQQVMSEHNQNAIRRRKYQYLLRGFLFCGQCGNRIYAEKHKKPSGLIFDYYFCQKCSKSHSQVGQIEKQVEESFKTIQLPKRLIDKIISKAKEILSHTHEEVDKDRRLLYNRKIGLEKRRNILETKLLDDVINNDTYSRQHTLIEEELKQVQKQIDALNQDRTINIEVFEKLLLLARNIYKAYQEAPTELKRQYLNLFWEKFEIKNRQIEKAVPTKLFQALLNQNSISLNPIRVRVNYNWLRSPSAIRTLLNDFNYWGEIKQLLQTI